MRIDIWELRTEHDCDLKLDEIKAERAILLVDLERNAMALTQYIALYKNTLTSLMFNRIREQITTLYRFLDSGIDDFETNMRLIKGRRLEIAQMIKH